MSEGSYASQVAALEIEFQTYVEKLKRDWLSKNRSTSRDVFEVMRPREKEEVYHRIDEWGRYITPLAEAWWSQRGWAVIWPDDNSQPMQYRKLEAP